MTILFTWRLKTLKKKNPFQSLFGNGESVSGFKFRSACKLPPAKLCITGFLFGISLAPLGSRGLGQESSRSLSPTESYKAALAPFTATRNQANDLTDADRYALGIGMAKASQDCQELSRNTSAFAADGKELFALAQLCLFGQQFESARAALVSYLALPQPPQREQALALLVRAFLGLKEPESAEPQIRSMLRDYSYDASIHIAIDQVIDDTEGAGPHLNDLALQLCATQSAATLPLLAGGKALEGKDGSASPATLFADAVRCDALAQASGKPSELEKLAGILQQPNLAGTVDLVLMQGALQRQQMVGREASLRSLHGDLLGPNAVVPRTLFLTHGTVLLVPFTLWSPSMPEIVGDLRQLAPQQPIYAITSWHANTGGGDAPSSQMLDGLRSWQRILPRRVLILVVPDTELRSFHADSFPAGILIREGIVLTNSVLSSPGAERALVNNLMDRTSAVAGQDRRQARPDRNSKEN